jgi:hypothetical protein
VAVPARPDPRSQLRVSDDERREIAQLLRRHYEEGRLTLTEYEERTEQAFGARVYADFDGILDDLPVPAGSPQPPLAPPGFAVRPPSAMDGFRGHLNVYLVISAFLIFIWAFTSRGYFWPAWPMAGWGIAVVLHWLAARSSS